MIAASFLPKLRCPIDGCTVRHMTPTELSCGSGHKYPVIDDIPVMLVERTESTLHVLDRSVDATRSGRIGDDPLFIATLGVDDDQRIAISRDFTRGSNAVDPVVNY